MPQFPYERNSNLKSEGPEQSYVESSTGALVSGNAEASTPESKQSRQSQPASQAKQDSKNKKPPTKFKTVEPKGPVTRVKVDRRSRSKTKSSKSPFKDLGLLEDTDSLVQFREDYGKPLVFLVLAIAVVALIFWWSRRESTTNVGANSDMAALILEANELEKQNPTTLDSRLILFSKQLTVADKLMAINESVANNKGAATKLSTLIHWNTININNGIDDQNVVDQLESASREQINNRDKSISNQAKIGLTLIRIHKYLKDPKIRYFPELLDQFQLVANFSAQDLSSAESLFRVADTFESRGLPNESAQLFRAINLSCSTSHNEKIAAIGLEARNRLAESSTLFDDLKSLVDNSEIVPLESVRALVSKSIQSETATAVNVESILDFIEFLVHRDSISESNTLLDDVSGAIYLVSAGIERDAIKKRFDEIQKRVQQHGKPFSFEGLFSVEGRPISHASLKRQPKMLIFWSLENTKSVGLLRQISENYKKFENRKIQVVAIAKISDDKEDRDRIVRLSNETRGIEFLTLAKESTKSHGFIGRFPVPQLPYWVLLDADNRVQGINVPPEIIDIPK